MACLFKDPSKLSQYRDRKFSGTQEEFELALLNSTTVYTGNISFYTTEEQVYELFSRAGEIKRIIIGLDKNTKTPCGFCFVLCEMNIVLIMIQISFDLYFPSCNSRQFLNICGYGKLVQRELEARQLVDYNTESLATFDHVMPLPYVGGSGRHGGNHGYGGGSNPHDRDYHYHLKMYRDDDDRPAPEFSRRNSCYNSRRNPDHDSRLPVKLTFLFMVNIFIVYLIGVIESSRYSMP